MAMLVRDSTPTLGVAIDDLGDLDQQADGTQVSVVGWIRARQQLSQLVAGEPCVGLALACHQRYPGVLETLNDFELVDESGRAIMMRSIRRMPCREKYAAARCKKAAQLTPVSSLSTSA